MTDAPFTETHRETLERFHKYGYPSLETLEAIAAALAEIDRLRADYDDAKAEIDRLRFYSRELRDALQTLRHNANRLCDRQLGGTYEDDCRLSIAKADAVLRPTP